MLQKLEQKKRDEVLAVKNIPLSEENFNRIIHSILHSVHFKGAKVVCSGVGKAGQVAHNIATTLSSTGTPSVFLHPAESLHGDLGLVQRNDVLLLVSNSGETFEVLELLRLAKLKFSDICCFAILGRPDSSLGNQVQAYLETGNPPEICPLGLTPTSSTTCMMVLGDLLVTEVMERINFTKEMYASCHHSGYLGKKARGEIDMLSSK